MSNNTILNPMPQIASQVVFNDHALTSKEQKTRSIAWYRSPVEPKVLKELHQRSDWMGFAQTLGYLTVLTVTGIAAYWSVGRLHPVFVVGLIFLNGMGYSFAINGVHELSHGTVFKTKALNAFFVRVLSFLGWINFEIFEASHARHHRYTLHHPDDQEVVLPLKMLVLHFFQQGFVAYEAFFITIRDTVKVACNQMCNSWEESLFPEGSHERRLPVNWARFLLLGHGLIIGISIYYGLWLLPVLICFGSFYGGWLHILCNKTQHIGLQDDVSDFRLCCRTFTVNPVVQFLYWHMNYHIEHHMYAAVPCYKLGKLHCFIKHDLPPCCSGLVATWQEIAEIQAKQKEDPDYQFVPPLPAGAGHAL